MAQKRDHGGGLDAAIAQYGGERADWIDLSTGINPTTYPFDPVQEQAWHDLPDQNAKNGLIHAARDFWNIPSDSEVVAASGVSQLIAAIPLLKSAGTVSIAKPTYNEHEAAFSGLNWKIGHSGSAAVVVHPNNPDGRLMSVDDLPLDDSELIVIDESFCDTCPENSLIELTARDNVIVLKGLGKYWGLGGLRLGFAIGPQELIEKLANLIGPWPVSGPALAVGTQALRDNIWANQTRTQLDKDAYRLDELFASKDISLVGGTSLFRTYSTSSATGLQKHFAKSHIWTRIFPYSENWIRLGLPASQKEWQRVSDTLEQYQ